MKGIESYGKDTAAGCRDTLPGLFRFVVSGFPSTNCANFYSTKRKSAKILRIHPGGGHQGNLYGFCHDFRQERAHRAVFGDGCKIFQKVNLAEL